MSKKELSQSRGAIAARARRAAKKRGASKIGASKIVPNLLQENVGGVGLAQAPDDFGRQSFSRENAIMMAKALTLDAGRIAIIVI